MIQSHLLPNIPPPFFLILFKTDFLVFPHHILLILFHYVPSLGMPCQTLPLGPSAPSNPEQGLPFTRSPAGGPLTPRSRALVK